MKPLLFTLFILFSGLMLNAQNAQQAPMPLVPQKSIPLHHTNNFTPVPNNPHHTTTASSRTASAQVLLDYVDADAAQYPGQGNYGLFIFPLNTRYTKAMGLANDNDTTGDAAGTNDTRRNTYMNYGVVTFDTLYDNYSQTSFTRKAVDSIYIDTVFFGLSHKNLSGQNDTLYINLVALNAAGYPILTTVYAADTIYTDTSLNSTVSKSLDTLATYEWTPGTKIKAQQFGIVEYYYGPFEDTLYLWSGAPLFPSEGNCSFPNGTVLALQSAYYSNSVSYWADLQEELPSSNGSFEYYPCTSADKTYTPELDGASYIEDIDFIASVRLDTNGLTGGIHGLNSTFALTSLYPNPAGQTANLSLQLKTNTNLNIELVDLTGRVVKSFYQENQTIGTQQYQLDLSDVASGAYLVNVIASDGSNDYAKLIVIK